MRPPSVDDTVFSRLDAAGIKTYFTVGLPRAYGGMERVMRQAFGVRRMRAMDEIGTRASKSDPGGWGFSDDIVLRDVLATLQEHKDERIFVVAELMDSHPPYLPCSPAGGHVERPDLSPLINALNCVDTSIGLFVTGLKAKGLFTDETLIVVTADHSPTHGEYLRHTSAIDLRPARVPLWLITPNRDWFPKDIGQQLASQIDLAPTILGFYGVEVPLSYWGRNLLDTDAENIAISNERGFLRVRISTKEYVLNPKQ